jgi:hypothetical protein
VTLLVRYEAVHDLSVAFCFLKHLILLKFMFECTQHKQDTKIGICLVGLDIENPHKLTEALCFLCGYLYGLQFCGLKHYCPKLQDTYLCLCKFFY